MNSEALIENFKKLMRQGMFYAKRAHDFIFEESSDVMIAVSCLNVAVSKFSAAEALYYSQLDVLERHEVEELFHLFDVFANELLNNAHTDHSHQWTSIEYEKLREVFDYSAFAFENS